MVLIDANARAAVPMMPYIGSCVDDKQNKMSKQLYEMLECHDMMAVSTFQEYHWGTIYTWTHPNGHHKSRLDYILCPTWWSHSEIISWVNHDFRMPHAAEDHDSVSARFRWAQQAAPVSKKGTRIPHEKLAGPQAQTKLKKILANTPTIHWEENATVHAEQVTHYWQEELKAAFREDTHFRAQAFATDATVETFKQFVTKKRAVRAITQKVHRWFLQAIFDKWAGRCWTVEQVWTCFRAQLKVAFLSLEYKSSAATLKKNLREDKKQYLHEVVTNIKEAPAHEIWKALRPLLPHKKCDGPGRALPQVRNAMGNMTQSRQEYEHAWISHFRTLETGTPVDLEAFVTNTIDRQQRDASDLQVRLEEMPALADLERAIRTSHCFKATGPNGLPNELFKAQPAYAAKLLWPLAMKYSLRREEAVQFKGGKLISLYKGKGSHADCASFRGILLMSTAGKIVRAAMRKHVNAPYLRQGEELQMAGKPNLSVLFGAQALRQLHLAAADKGHSVALIFADIRAAYYTVLRQISIGASTADEDIAKILQKLALGPEVMHELQAALQGETAYQQLSASPHQEAILQESMTGTWFTCFQNDFTETHKGTRPGDSWADIVFNVMFAAILRDIQRTLSELPVWFNLPAYSHRSLTAEAIPQKMKQVVNIAWADDLALPLIFPKPQDVFSYLPIVVDKLLTALEARGMKAHIGPGKTAAIIVPRGPGAVAVKRKLFARKESFFMVLRENETCSLPLIAQYRHLGGVIAAKGGMLPEIRARLSRARSAFWRGAKRFFRNERLPLDLRTQVFQATVMAALQWGVGTWPKLNIQEQKAFETACWEMYMQIVPKAIRKDSILLSHEELLLHLDVDHPEAIFASAHARHYLTMVQSAPDLVWSIFRQDHRTQTAYQDAFCWMNRFLARDKGLPAMSGADDMTDFLHCNPGIWRAAIKRALKRSRQWHKVQARVYLWHKQIYIAMESAGLMALQEDLTRSSNLCLICQRAFTTKKGWFLHTSQKHNYQTMHGEAAQGTVCHCCAKCYPHQTALLAHLRYSPNCCAWLWARRQQSVHAPQVRPQAAWRYTGEGPIRAEQAMHRDLQRFCTDLDEALHKFEVDVETPDFYNRLYDRFITVCTRPMHYPDLLTGFRDWCNQYLTTTDLQLRDTLHRVLQWLQERPGQCANDLRQVHVCATEKIRQTVLVRAKPMSIRSFMPTQIVFLHLFSGRRRKGDIQTALENLVVPAGCQMLVISVDIVVSREKCDLMTPDQQKRWLQLARDGVIAGLCAGPPCETWSVARETAVEDGTCKRPPRPLRSFQELWGQCDLTAREFRQLDTANTLMGFTLSVCFLQAYTGGFALMEHPRSPAAYMKNKAHAASIWRSAVIQWLLATGWFFQQDVSQGFYGAPSPKPTTFLITGVNCQCAADLEKVSRTTPMPANVSIGRENGQWRTSRLKEYPNALCNYIARLFQTWLIRHKDREPRDFNHEASWLQDLIVHEDDAVTSFGPDFAF